MPRFHSPLIEPDVRICRIRLSDGIRKPAHGRAQGPVLHRPPSSFRDRRVWDGGARPHGHSPTLGPFHNAPEVRPLPSAGITRLRRYYEPVRLPRRPGLSLAGVRLGHAPTAGGLPCCVDSPCAGMPAPLPRRDRRRDRVAPRTATTAAFPQCPRGRLPHQSFRGLLGVHCSLRPACSRGRCYDPFHRRLRQFRYLHRRSDCYWLEQQLPGGNCTH